MQNELWMHHAITLAKKAGVLGEIPVGVIVVDRRSGNVIAQAHNEVEMGKTSVAHAEILAIQRASTAVNSSRLDHCDIYITLEPCAMCAMAISHARIGRVIFGAYDPKSGGVEHGARIYSHATTHHKPEVISGVCEMECAALLKEFFKNLR